MHKFFSSKSENSGTRIHFDALWVLLNIAVSVYVSLIRLLPSAKAFPPILIVVPILGLGIYYLNNAICRYLIKQRSVDKDGAIPFSAKRFCIFMAIVFVCMLTMFLRYFPGGISPDNVNQWTQIQTGEFSDWHPFAHTFLLFLATKILNKYWFVLLIQLIAFSAGCAYFAETLYRYGFSIRLLLLSFYVFLVNRSGRIVMLYLWKDSMLTIFVLFIMAQTVSIVMTRGRWLCSKKNRIFFSVLLGYATLLRYNAMFFTIPLFVLMMLMYDKKALTRCAVIAICTIFVVKVPLSAAFSVSKDENQVFGESIGLPMTILTDTYWENPDALPEEIRIIFDNLTHWNGTAYDWASEYAQGNYNSVKLVCDMVTPLKEIGTLGILKDTFVTSFAAPGSAIRAVVELTDMVWTLEGSAEGSLRNIVRSDLDKSVCEDTISVSHLFAYIDGVFQSFLETSVLGTLPNMIGFYSFLIACAVLYGYSRHGLSALVLTVPTLCYNLCTMLLLMGNDYRFFDFSTIIGFAISVFVVLPWGKAQQSEKK